MKPGDRLKFFMHPDGSVVLLPKWPAAAILRGIVKSRRGPVILEEMGEGSRCRCGPRTHVLILQARRIPLILIEPRARRGARFHALQLRGPTVCVSTVSIVCGRDR